MKRIACVLGIAVVLILYWMWLEPPKKFEDLTPEERLMMDIDATVIF